MTGMLAALTYAPTRRAAIETRVFDHLPMVRKIAWHVHGRVANAIEIDDLVQIGTVALIEAGRAYEDRGHAFSTYASVRVRGAMMDALRRHAAGARHAIKRRREFEMARQRFAQSKGRAPTEAEMASLVEMSVDDYLAAVSASAAIKHESIDDLYSDHSMWFADIEDLADDRLAKAQLADLLTASIDTLPERQALVLQLYFVEEMNLDEIGATLGIGAARVCQIKKAALDTLRKRLKDAV